MKTTFLSFITYQDNKKEDCDQPTLMFCAILPLPVQLELLVQVLWRNKYRSNKVFLAPIGAQEILRVVNSRAISSI